MNSGLLTLSPTQGGFFLLDFLVVRLILPQMTKPWQLQTLEFDLRSPQTKKSCVQHSISGAPGRTSYPQPSKSQVFLGPSEVRRSKHPSERLSPASLGSRWNSTIFQEVPEVFNSRLKKVRLNVSSTYIY